MEDWIAARGVWPIDDEPGGAPIPDRVLADAGLSLMAKGLLALLLAKQGQPVNPYEDAYEDEADIRSAVDELIAAGLAVRVQR
ncbi:hypothetical protein [Microbacterium sp.]|uniref:hypothetical protein n=1 Tax=Microbacterium sp. TaxID=51671 RepID=UPI0025DBEC03|nr:hypothetical protein [Microbacterium sp.]MBT9605751.1 hypothetical protein [Microbacterium sp.]